jgi:hypothetical protein
MGKSGVSAFLISIVLLLSIPANAQISVCSKHLKIQESTQRHWNPGIVTENSAQAGGSIYEVKIKVKKGSNIAFEKLIAEGQALDIELKQNGQRGAQGPFKKGDEIILSARTDKQQPLTNSDQEVATAIRNKKATGAILYTLNDKKYIQTIANFTVWQNGKPIQ